MKKLVMLISFIFLFSSCSEDMTKNNDDFLTENSINTEMAKKYLEFYTSKKKAGSILIQSNTSKLIQNTSKNISFQEKPTDDKTLPNNKIEIKDLNTEISSKLNQKNYVGMFGRNVSYKVINNNINNKNNDDFDSVYIPELINIDINTDRLQPGTTISWNVDNLNQNGVVVSVEYNAINQLDTRLAFDNPSSIRRSFVIEDTQGSYTISQNDLDIFPNNALLDINVLRAGFDVDENTGVSIAGVSKVSNSKFVEY